MHGQSMMNTIMAKDEIVGSGHKLMSFIMGKSKTTCPTRTRHKVRSLGGVGFGKYIAATFLFGRLDTQGRDAGNAVQARTGQAV
jgi:hypothetical protein